MEYKHVQYTCLTIIRFCFLVFLIFSVFGTVCKIKLTLCQLLSVCTPNIVSYCIVSRIVSHSPPR